MATIMSDWGFNLDGPDAPLIPVDARGRCSLGKLGPLQPNYTGYTNDQGHILLIPTILITPEHPKFEEVNRILRSIDETGERVRRARPLRRTEPGQA